MFKGESDISLSLYCTGESFIAVSFKLKLTRSRLQFRLSLLVQPTSDNEERRLLPTDLD